MDMSLNKLWEIVKNRDAWHAAVHGVTQSWTRLSDYTTKYNSNLWGPKIYILQASWLVLCIWELEDNSEYMSSVQFSCSVVSDSLRPHELQHARPPCPSPTPGVYPNSCPLSRWCHPTISSSVVPFSSCLQSFPTSDGQNIGVSASTSVLPMNTLDWFPLGWTGWISLQSKGLSRVFSDTTVKKHQLLCWAYEWPRINVIRVKELTTLTRSLQCYLAVECIVSFRFRGSFQRLWLGLWSQEDSVLIQEIQDEDVDYFHCCRNVKKRIDMSDF